MVIILALVGCMAVGSLALLQTSDRHGTVAVAQLPPEKPKPAPAVFRTPIPPPALRGPYPPSTSFQLRTAKL